MLFTITLSVKPNKYLEINFFNEFLDQPVGDELDLIITFILKILQSIIQYKFAWNEKTDISFLESINLSSSKRQIRYLNFLDVFFKKLSLGFIISMFLNFLSNPLDAVISLMLLSIDER